MDVPGTGRRQRAVDVYRLREQVYGEHCGGDVDGGLPAGATRRLWGGFSVYFGSERAIVAAARQHGLHPLGPRQQLASSYYWPRGIGWIDFDDGASYACTGGRLVWDAATGRPRPPAEQPRWKGWRLIVVPAHLRRLVPCALRTDCTVCGGSCPVSGLGRLLRHRGESGERCDGSHTLALEDRA